MNINQIMSFIKKGRKHYGFAGYVLGLFVYLVFVLCPKAGGPSDTVIIVVCLLYAILAVLLYVIKAIFELAVPVDDTVQIRLEYVFRQLMNARDQPPRMNAATSRKWESEAIKKIINKQGFVNFADKIIRREYFLAKRTR
jgi:hypothetical protein